MIPRSQTMHKMYNRRNRDLVVSLWARMMEKFTALDWCVMNCTYEQNRHPQVPAAVEGRRSSLQSNSSE
ncbi:hypothetical protein KC351_g28 [Hortaea werneckii]|nr:hypothetical protein KC351_g28 [Hortaea werneckii]